MKTITYDETKWQLVPKEPIDEMIDNAFEIRDGDIPKQTIIGIYKDMLEDAPEAPAQPALDERAKGREMKTERITTDEAREILIDYMNENFTDRTFSQYIRGHLAGDFAWQMGRAILANKAAPEASAQPVPDRIPDVGKTIQPVNAQDAERLNWLEKMVVNVREPQLHGSKDLFWSSPEQEQLDWAPEPSDIRARIDAAKKAAHPRDAK